MALLTLDLRGKVLHGRLEVVHASFHGSEGQGQESGDHPEDWTQKAEAEEQDLAIAAGDDEGVQGFIEARGTPSGEAV